MKNTEYINDIILEVGFSVFLKRGRITIFSIDHELEDVNRFFSPQIISLRGGNALVGILGSIKADVLRDAAGIISDYFVVVAFSANFSSLRSPPILGLSRGGDLEWCEKIRRVVSRFPRNRQEYIDMKNNEYEIDGFPISRMGK